MIKSRKILILFILSIILLTACNFKSSTNNKENLITVISREEGSGTRGAFVELSGVEKKEEVGEKMDRTTDESIIHTKTDAVLSAIESDKNSIGYMSLGSLNNRVKALSINGVDPSANNIKSGNYKLVRAFNISYLKKDKKVEDFINFILSNQGQEIVSEDYIEIESEENKKDYESNYPKGKIIVAGSSSVTPLMEKLKEGYNKINNKLDIEIQLSDSSSGISSVLEGTADIAMSSRELTDSELEQLKYENIALDGIAVVVNNRNKLTDISIEDLKKVYIGEIKSWDELELDR